MQEAINYFREHAIAENRGMAVDWRMVSSTMARMLEDELKKAATLQPQPAQDRAAAENAGDQAQHAGDQDTE